MKIDPSSLEKTSDSWLEWRKHILTELDRLNSKHDQIDLNIDKLRDDIYKQTSRMKIELATLKVKSGVWGMFAGLIPVVIAILMKYMS